MSQPDRVLNNPAKNGSRLTYRHYRTDTMMYSQVCYVPHEIRRAWLWNLARPLGDTCTRAFSTVILTSQVQAQGHRIIATITTQSSTSRRRIFTSSGIILLKASLINVSYSFPVPIPRYIFLHDVWCLLLSKVYEINRVILCPRLGAEWIWRISWLPNSLRSKPRKEYTNTVLISRWFPTLGWVRGVSSR